MTLIDESTPQAQAQRFSGVRARLARSPLVQGGGFLRTRIVGADGLSRLVHDAEAAHASAVEAHETSPGLDARGAPDRWLESAPGGSALQQFAESGDLLDVLIRATGVGWKSAGPGSWSYYRREGHYLGLHRDLAVCDLAVITCVRADGSGSSDGVLRLWPTRAKESLAQIRARPEGGIDVRLAPGESALLLGGVVAHQVTPLSHGQVRVVAPLCYQVLPCDC